MYMSGTSEVDRRSVAVAGLAVKWLRRGWRGTWRDRPGRLLRAGPGCGRELAAEVKNGHPDRTSKARYVGSSRRRSTHITRLRCDSIRRKAYPEQLGRCGGLSAVPSWAGTAGLQREI